MPEPQGIDVNHAEQAAKKNEHSSLAAVVGSMDEEGAQFAAEIVEQSGKKEIFGGLKEASERLFTAFERRNGEKPKEVVLFRDGVSEGEFEQVKEEEVQQIREAAAMTGRGEETRLTVISTQKRHHTRFYYTEGNGGDVVANPCPGTVVDTDIVSTTWRDFFLNSHAAISNTITAKPTHYCVLVDDIGLTSAGAELLSYWECYAYARANRSVSVPAPAFYAHLAAKRARELKRVNATGAELEQASSHWASSSCPMFWL